MEGILKSSLVVLQFRNLKNRFCSSSFAFSFLLLVCFLSTRPWDPLNDLIQFEIDGCIQTKVRHRTPMVRSGSLISLSNQGSRRDNCKCQVCCPGDKACHRLIRLSRISRHTASIVASSLCATTSPLPPS